MDGRVARSRFAHMGPVADLHSSTFINIISRRKDTFGCGFCGRCMRLLGCDVTTYMTERSLVRYVFFLEDSNLIVTLLVTNVHVAGNRADLGLQSAPRICRLRTLALIRTGSSTDGRI